MLQLITERTRVTQCTESTLDTILTTTPGLHTFLDEKRQRIYITPQRLGTTVTSKNEFINDI